MPEYRDELIARIAAELRIVPPLDERFDARVMAEIATLPQPAPARLTMVAQWLRRPRNVRMSPLAGLAAAAALAAVLVWSRSSRSPALAPLAPAAAPGVLLASHGSTVVQFVLVAPDAKSVSLVGDFNDWDPTATPLRTASGAWSVAVRLIPGRHRYAFVLDGVRWIADPLAPPAPDDDFGSPGSVVTVGA